MSSGLVYKQTFLGSVMPQMRSISRAVQQRWQHLQRARSLVDQMQAGNQHLGCKG